MKNRTTSQKLVLQVKAPSTRMHIILSQDRLVKLRELVSATRRGPSEIIGELIDRAEVPNA